MSHIVLKSERLKERGLIFLVLLHTYGRRAECEAKRQGCCRWNSCREWGRNVGNQKNPTLLPCKFHQRFQALCFSAMLERELHTGLSWKCIVALMRKVCVISSVLCPMDTHQPHSKASVLAVSETAHRKYIKPNEITVLCEHSPNLVL